MKKDNKIWPHIAPIVVLTVICMVVTAALAFANYLTAPVIAANQQSMADGAKQLVLPAGADFEALPESELPPGVDTVHKAGNGAGYVFTMKTRGYAEFTIMVGVGSDGKIAGTQVIAHTETDGIGTKVVDNDSDFQKNLVGIDDASAIQVISGATMSSNGVKNAVQTALDGYTILSGGKVEAKLSTAPENFTEADLELYFPGATFAEVPGGMTSDAGTVVYGEAQGMESTIRVAVFFDNDANIMGLVAYTKRETEYLGDIVGDNSVFIDSFKGISDVDGVDSIAGATITSEAVKAAVKQAVANLETVKGGA